MEILYVESIRKILQNKAKLEKELGIKITNKGRDIIIEAEDGNATDEYVAAKVIEALELGFSLQQALLLCDENFILEKIHIKQLTKRHDLNTIRGRIIGTKGKTKKLIENLSECLISLHGNTIGIISRAEDIKKAINALNSLIHGQKQSRVYSYLERERSRDKTRVHGDLGLRIKEKRKKREK